MPNSDFEQKPTSLPTPRRNKWSRKQLLGALVAVNLLGVITGILPRPDVLIFLVNVTPGLTRATIPITQVNSGAFEMRYYYLTSRISRQQLRNLIAIYDFDPKDALPSPYLIQDEIEFGNTKVYQPFKRAPDIEFYSTITDLGMGTDHVVMTLYYNKNSGEMLWTSRYIF